MLISKFRLTMLLCFILKIMLTLQLFRFKLYVDCNSIGTGSVYQDSLQLYPPTPAPPPNKRIIQLPDKTTYFCLADSIVPLQIMIPMTNGLLLILLPPPPPPPSFYHRVVLTATRDQDYSCNILLSIGTLKRCHWPLSRQSKR